MTAWMIWLALVVAPPTPSPRAAGSMTTSPTTRRRATRLTPGARASPVEGASRRGDDDWYRLKLERGDRLVVGLRFHPTARFEPPALFPPRGRKGVGRRTRGRGQARLEHIARRAGVYRLRVRSPEQVRAAYALSLQVGGSKPALRYPPMAPGKSSTRR
ncbi:MAG: hypothetical protein R3F60_19915 [bacterium]